LTVTGLASEAFTTSFPAWIAVGPYSYCCRPEATCPIHFCEGKRSSSIDQLAGEGLRRVIAAAVSREAVLAAVLVTVLRRRANDRLAAAAQVEGRAAASDKAVAVGSRLLPRATG